MNALRHLLAIPFAVLACSQLSAAESGYLPDQNDCLVANPHPKPDEHVSWTGACKSGYADGWGILEFRQGQVVTQRYEGSLAAGRLEGEGTLTTLTTAGVSGVDGVWSRGRLVSRVAGPARVVTYSDGGRYEGELKGDLRHGYGELAYPDLKFLRQRDEISLPLKRLA
jgi:hypothetical protein